MPWIEKSNFSDAPARYQLPRPLSDHSILGTDGAREYAMEQRRFASQAEADPLTRKDAIKRRRVFDFIVRYYAGDADTTYWATQGVGKDLAVRLDWAFKEVDLMAGGDK